MTPQKSAATLQDKFGALDKAMRSRLVEREDDIEIFKLALLTKSHAFFLGEPGIAKSFMVDIGRGIIDGLTPEDYFYMLFMKGSAREEVFGPLDLHALDQGRYRFLTEGYLPNAKLAFGDEFWKGNSAIQNALLLATNERKFKNDGKVYDIPLHTMFIASNEMPESDELRAIYDRMLFRKTVKRVQEPGNKVKMLKLGMGVKTHLDPVMTWDDVEKAHEEVCRVVIPADVLDALVEVTQKLAQEEIFPSDRRLVQSIVAVQAMAWLDGEAEAEIEHLRICRHIFWDDPDDFPTVEKILMNLVNPLNEKIVAIMAEVEKVRGQMEKAIADNLDDDMKQRAGGQIYDKLSKAKDDLRKIGAELPATGAKRHRFDEGAATIRKITTRMLMKLYDMDEDEIDVAIIDPNEGVA